MAARFPYMWDYDIDEARFRDADIELINDVPTRVGRSKNVDWKIRQATWEIILRKLESGEDK